MAGQRAVSAPPRVLYTDAVSAQLSEPPVVPPLLPALTDALRALSPAEVPAVLLELAGVLSAAPVPDRVPAQRLTPGFLRLRDLVDGELLARGDPDI